MTRSTTFLGQAYKTRSPALADQLCINLFFKKAESNGTKDFGVLYGTPGLRLAAALPTGPVRGVYRFGNLMYAVAGTGVYSVDKNFNVTKLGSITTYSGPLSFIDNGQSGGKQVAFFDGTYGYIIANGAPLVSASILNGGNNYNVNDIVTLVDSNGPSPATAQIIVTSTGTGGKVTGFSIYTTGMFTAIPNLSQASTTGGGGGLKLTGAVLGTPTGLYKINLPFTNPTLANYQDGYGVCVEGGTITVWQSNLFDLSIWSTTAFSNVQAKGTNLQAIGFLHRQLVMLQENTAEVWINQGTANFAFAEEQGVHLEVGIAAPYSLAQAGETLVWLAQTLEGRNAVVQMRGYEAIEISTDAVEYAISQYPTTSDAIGYTFRQEKNVFYVLNFPSANATWVCNLTGEEKVWHQWLYFSNGSYSRHLSNCATFFNEQTIVGDYSNGNLYIVDMNTHTDNGQPIRWSRSWRALGKPSEAPVLFKYLYIDMETGVDVPQGANPQVMLDWSDDGGYSWSPERFGSAGQSGQYGWRTKWTRLGATSRGQGEDRIWRISSSDQFAVALIGSYYG